MQEKALELQRQHTNTLSEGTLRKQSNTPGPTVWDKEKLSAELQSFDPAKALELLLQVAQKDPALASKLLKEQRKRKRKHLGRNF